MDIDMPEGWELDALVAEKVMRLKIWKYDCYFGNNAEGYLCTYRIPDYSTDIKIAFKVVEEVCKKDYWFELSFTDNLTACFINKDGHVISSEAETPALAICRVALKVVNK